jgi:hypothetical protein
MPLSMPEAKGPSEDYCKYCTDEKGKSKTKNGCAAGNRAWFKSWQPTSMMPRR